MKLFLSLLLLIVNYLPAQTIITKHFIYQDRSREYIVFLPGSFLSEQKLPVYIALHGNISTNNGMMDYTDLNDIADTANFIAVYPQGVSKSWADGRGATDADKMHVDDVGFISALIDTIVVNYHADKNRVYVAGISNGGFMVQRLLCELADKIASGASVAAEVPDNMPLFFGSKCIRPVVIMHGTKDKYVPYTGGTIHGKNGGNGNDGYSLSADSSFHLWARRDGCGKIFTEEQLPDKVRKDNCTVVKKTFHDCKGENNVILYEIINGGHSWPGGRSTLVTQLLLGNTNEDINAGEETWNFFKTKTLQVCDHP